MSLVFAVSKSSMPGRDAAAPWGSTTWFFRVRAPWEKRSRSVLPHSRGESSPAAKLVCRSAAIAQSLSRMISESARASRCTAFPSEAIAVVRARKARFSSIGISCGFTGSVAAR